MQKLDKELLECIEKGDSSAFTELYNRYWRLLYNWTSNRVVSRETVQDILQNVWIDIWLNPLMIKTDNQGSAKSILLGFVSYRILDFFKKKDILLFESDETISNESMEKLSYSHILEEFQLKEIHAIIDKILSKLPQLARDIYILSERKNLAPKEIAKQLSVTEETVRRRLAWTNGIVQSKLTKYYFGNTSILVLIMYAQTFLK